MFRVDDEVIRKDPKGLRLTGRINYIYPDGTMDIIFINTTLKTMTLWHHVNQNDWEPAKLKSKTLLPEFL